MKRSVLNTSFKGYSGFTFTVPENQYSPEIFVACSIPKDKHQDIQIQILTDAFAFGCVPNTVSTREIVDNIQYLSNHGRIAEAWENISELLVREDPQWEWHRITGAHATQLHLALNYRDEKGDSLQKRYFVTLT